MVKQLTTKKKKRTKVSVAICLYAENKMYSSTLLNLAWMSHWEGAECASFWLEIAELVWKKDRKKSKCVHMMKTFLLCYPLFTVYTKGNGIL